MKRNGAPCRARATPEFGYLFCQAVHDPNVNSTDPQVFRSVGLQPVAVWDYRGHKDAYTSKTKQDMERLSTELDHVLELHVVRDAFDKLQPQGACFGQRKEALKQDLKVSLNEKENLNFTREYINQVKFRGVYVFQQDYGRDNVHHESGLVGYLIDAKDDVKYPERRLSRRVSRNIKKEIVKSYDHVRDQLRDEDGAHGQFIAHLHDNMVAMKLWH